MKLKHVLLIFAAYEVVAFINNKYALTSFVAPLDLIGTVL